ncbi:MAG: DMT family transporter [Actinomycetota bacterium]
MNDSGAPSSATPPRPLALPAIALAAALWAVAASIARDLFAAGVTPFELAEARAVVACVGLALVPASWRRPARRPPTALVLLLGVAIALVNATYYVAIARLPVAVAIVLQYTGPALVVAWVGAVARRRPSPAVVLSLLAAFAGVILVTGVLGGRIARLDALGVVMGFAAALFFATYTLVSEEVRRYLPPLGVLLRAFAAASLFWILLQVPQGSPAALWRAENLPGVLFVGFGGTLAPFLLYVWAIAHVRAERAVIAATLEPVLAALAAWVLLGQTLAPTQLLGGALVIAAVALLQLSARERPLVGSAH